MAVSTAYKQLAANLRAQIAAGAFPPSRRLPTDAELSATSGVSRQTVRRAFDELVDEGLVYRVPGRGSFAVGAPAPSRDEYLRSVGSIDDLLALATDTNLEVIEPLAETVDIAAAGRLRLPSDRVVAGVFRRLHRGAPFSLTRIYLPPQLGRQVAADERVTTVGMTSPITVIALVDAMNDNPIACAHQSISAAKADRTTAALIGCQPGASVLTIDRVYFDARGEAVELALSTFNTDRYTYRLELRRRVR
jgi:DNA-binding GntR family transcriptional regulator